MKRFLVLCFAAALAFGTLDASAHAIVTGSSLQETVSAGKPTKVLLTFNSGIELDLSRVWLVSAGDVHTPVAIAAGRKPGKLLVNLPALTPGEYWRSAPCWCSTRNPSSDQSFVTAMALISIIAPRCRSRVGTTERAGRWLPMNFS